VPNRSPTAARIPPAAAAPAPAASASTLRKAGLGVQLEVHDRHQLEARFSYALGAGEGAQKYTVDAYFFVPRNVGVNRHNFSREQFYADVTALMRLDAAKLPLEQLADRRNPGSPLFRIAEALESLRISARPPSSRPVVVHVKLYAYLYTQAVKSELGGLSERLDEQCRAGPPEWAPLEAEAEALLARLREGLRAYRRMRTGFWPFERMTHEMLPEALRAADEYMSLYLEERLTLFAAGLDAPGRLDGSGAVARLRLAFAALAEEEAAHRRRYGYLVCDPGGDRGEYFTYRSSLLKKAVQQALYLDLREVKRDTYLRNAVGAVGAALAAIWALATQLPATLAAVDSQAKLWFFAAAVLAYVMKDRIKALTNEYLTNRLRRHDHTSWLYGESLGTIGLGMLRARLREAMRFQKGSEVPPEVARMRRTGRTVQNAELHGEEVIHYRKVVEIGTHDPAARLPEGYWVRDILRLNVRHFLTRLDDPIDHVAFFDPARRAFRSADLPKVYHLNLVLRITRENAAGEGQERFEHLRVVLNKDGIVRASLAAAVGPSPLAARRQRWKLPRFLT
jgi:hypothetical protein